MLNLVDDLGRTHVFKHSPKRLLSLVPSLTELLCDLGLETFLVGRTKFCIHPKSIQNQPIIGGTKNIRLEQIKALKPDFIIASKEENIKEQVESLEKTCPVFVSDIKTIEDSNQIIKLLGKFWNKESLAECIILKNHETIRLCKNDIQNNKTVYLIWKDPYMSVGADTYIHEVLHQLGYQNATQNLKRYPSLSTKQLQNLNPDHIFLSTEPFPFKQKHVEELQNICPDAKIQIVDGEFFSWYGSRLGKLQEFTVQN